MQLTRMKSLTFKLRLALAALLCSVVVASGARAQEAAAASPWVKVAPPNEAFTVMMPRVPFPVAERGKSGALKVAGQRYSLRHDDAEYTVWSFKAANLPAAPGDDDVEMYLDHSAEIAWDLMIEPYWKKLKRESPEELMRYNLTYHSALPSTGHPGRRYRLNLGERQGMTHIYLAGSQIYIVAAAGAARESAGVTEFIKSFVLNLPVPDAPAATPTGAAVAPERGGESNSGVGSGEAKESDYSRNFKASETTRKAQLLAKPEPSYTEWARRFSVTGTVRVRAILMASGRVGGITAITKLPHGLTQEAIEAARKIKFEPAVKDGRPVSQYVTIEYNFHIY